MSEPNQANSDKLVPIHRTSIGVLQADLGNWYGTPYLSGIADLAEAEDINLLCFIGQKLDQGDSGQNQVYRLATGRRLDGIIFYASLGHWASRERVSEFCDRYAALPRIGNALPVDCLPIVLPDSYSGMRQAVTHLVEVHGCKRVAFIQGPIGQLEAEQRYQAYCDVLVEHGLELDPALVVAGDYQHDTGRSAVRILLDTRQTSFDGLAAANDEMAIGAIEALQARGLRVPADVPVTGFDDADEARVFHVPLTTVRQSFYSLGHLTAATLLKVLAGEHVPNQVLVPTELIVRRSCGCMPVFLEQARIDPAARRPVGESSPAERQAVVVAALLQAVQQSERVATGSQAELVESMGQAWVALQAELAGEQSGVFLLSFETLIQQLRKQGYNDESNHAMLSVLRGQCLADLTQRKQTLVAENLLQQARLLVSDDLLRAQSYDKIVIERRERLLQELSYHLAAVLNPQEAAGILAEYLPRLNIPRCLIALYDRKADAPPGEAARLLMGYDARGAAIYPEGIPFRAQDLAPSGWLPAKQRYTAIVMPLSIQQEAIGFILFEIRERNWEFHARLRDLFESTLFRARLVQQREQARHEAEQLYVEARQRALELARAKEEAEEASRQMRVALQETEGLFRAAQAILGANELSDILQKLTTHFISLVQADRLFIFLVDHQRREIVYGVYNGNIVDDMDTTYTELEAGISGIVFRTAQPVLSLHAEDGIEPETTRERRKQAGTGAIIVVPLIALGQVIGTVTAVNRIDQRKFRQHDVDLLMALATQAATAIENARLFAAEREQHEFAEALRQAGAILNSTLDFNQVLDLLLELIQRVVPYDSGSVMLVENGHFARVSRQRGYDKVGRKAFDTGSLAFDIDQTASFRWMKETGEPHVIPDTWADPSWLRTPETEYIHSWVGAPIISQNGLIAFFSLNKTEANFYGPQSARRLAAFAGQAALALENARLYFNLAQFNQQLEEKVRLRTEEVSNAYEQLERLDRTKSDFISIASHELRTPITVLRGYSQILLGDGAIQGHPTLKQMVDGIHTGALRMYEIVNSMLDLAKIDSRALQLNTEPIFLSVLVKEEIMRFGSAPRERRLQITLDGLSGLPPVEADQDALRKVFYHLLGNAIKYTPDGGRIHICARVLNPGELENPAEGVLVSVSDTGIGIAPEFQELIFTKFYQTGEVALHSSSKTKFKGGGPGLGLTIARGIVEAHHGRLWVESPGYDEAACPGSTFYVALPMTQG